MNFYQLEHPLNSIAFIEESTGRFWSYGQLQEFVDRIKSLLTARPEKTLGVILCENNIESISGYLATLQTGHTVLLLNADLEKGFLKNLLEIYAPKWLFVPQSKVHDLDGYACQTALLDYQFLSAVSVKNTDIFPYLSVLLSTSGSTGSPKVVRLSSQNLVSNSRSIATYLKLNAEERPITTLPFCYSYGLSVINSHLEVGATILLTNQGLFTAAFWDFANNHRPTSFSGVPYTYQMLKQLRIDPFSIPSLRTLTQAGGRLSQQLIEEFHTLATKQGKLFYVMYGQTEATARISYVPPDILKDKIGSIGLPIPGGSLSISSDTQELVYRGKNVMLGYAECRVDLIKGDECQGVLYTGDVARVDPDGFHYIVGRSKRFVKLFGLRINLDEVEKLIEDRCDCCAACIGDDQKIRIFIEGLSKAAEIRMTVATALGIHPIAINVQVRDTLLRTRAGKLDYFQLAEQP